MARHIKDIVGSLMRVLMRVLDEVLPAGLNDLDFEADRELAVTLNAAFILQEFAYDPS